MVYQPVDPFFFGECYHDGFVGFKHWLCVEHPPAPEAFEAVGLVFEDIYKGAPRFFRGGRTPEGGFRES